VVYDVIVDVLMQLKTVLQWPQIYGRLSLVVASSICAGIEVLLVQLRTLWSLIRDVEGPTVNPVPYGPTPVDRPCLS
jgi:hypothetical protein